MSFNNCYIQDGYGPNLACLLSVMLYLGWTWPKLSMTFIRYYIFRLDIGHAERVLYQIYIQAGHSPNLACLLSGVIFRLDMAQT